MELNSPSVNTVSHGGQNESLCGCRGGLQLSAEPSTPSVNAGSHGGQNDSLSGGKWGPELSMEPSTMAGQGDIV